MSLSRRVLARRPAFQIRHQPSVQPCWDWRYRSTRWYRECGLRHSFRLLSAEAAALRDRLAAPVTGQPVRGRRRL